MELTEAKHLAGVVCCVVKKLCEVDPSCRVDVVRDDGTKKKEGPQTTFIPHDELELWTPQPSLSEAWDMPPATAQPTNSRGPANSALRALTSARAVAIASQARPETQPVLAVGSYWPGTRASIPSSLTNVAPARHWLSWTIAGLA